MASAEAERRRVVMRPQLRDTCADCRARGTWLDAQATLRDIDQPGWAVRVCKRHARQRHPAAFPPAPKQRRWF